MESQIPLNITTWLFAFSPIIVVLFLMTFLKWSGARAGCLALLYTFVIALVIFKANLHILSFSSTKGVLMSTFALYIIWGALFLFHVVNYVGGIKIIGNTLPRMVKNKMLQLMLAGVCFTSFLQAVAGFGVPIAVAAPLMVALGFNAATAVIATSIGYAWSITFGSMSASFIVIQLTSNVQAVPLAPWAALFTGLTGVLGSFLAAHAWGGFNVIKKGFWTILIPALAMTTIQGVLAVLGYYTIAILVASLVGMAVTVLMTRLHAFNDSKLPEAAAGNFAAGNFASGAVLSTENENNKISLPLAFAPYFFLIILVVLTSYWPELELWLKKGGYLSLDFPQYKTGYNWVVEATKYGKTSFFAHMGSYVTYAGIFGIILFALTGKMQLKDVKTIWKRVVDASVSSSIATASMVMIALVMVESGMTYTLARGIATVTGPVYPFFVTFVGILGGFITGSNVNSNVMFGALQRQVAELLGINIYIVAAAQTTGGAIGSVISPAKIILGVASVGLTGQEGFVLKKIFGYCIALAVILGLIIWPLVYLL